MDVSKAVGPLDLRCCYLNSMSVTLVDMWGKNPRTAGLIALPHEGNTYRGDQDGFEVCMGGFNGDFSKVSSYLPGARQYGVPFAMLEDGTVIRVAAVSVR
ncbi:MAG: hypothetical protein LBI39_02885 [Puniceicoccales bacterium]|jgi:hypothetical protein|nr:hypothetical protein [Puniceicoccales bacterium]